MRLDTKKTHTRNSQIAAGKYNAMLSQDATAGSKAQAPSIVALGSRWLSGSVQKAVISLFVH